MLTFLAAAGASAAIAMEGFRRRENRHTQTLHSLDVNVHVNGIRGKSTVTRMIGGVLRAAGYSAIAKTTGTYACVIDQAGGEHAIARSGPANINEQYDILKQWVTPEITAAVFECMAVKPKYQTLCQDVILRSPICVITNVRLDHQEDMGDTVEEIAASLCSTVPDHGFVVTGERNPDLVAILQEHCDAKGARLVVAEESALSRSLVDKFDYQQFEENVAVVLAVADLLGIDPETATRGMLAAAPDPGTTRVTRIADPEAPDLYWVPMFAINDWESTVRVFDDVKQGLPDDCHHVIALNNRADRTDRAAMFVDLVCEELLDSSDLIVLYGEIQEVVQKKLLDLGVPDDKIVTTLEADDSDGRELVNAARMRFEPDENVAVYGMVNIHTEAVGAMERYITALVEGSRAEVGVA
ncbi:poly-gamma-glutamate synthase PgsB [Corynebacterium liangguodongii]|uniref:Poly-gamma-glutamate synthase PgsB n=1 Tax=Corynebacterium liangguodongii TaxID=2079535 RepID=A0A2S0WDA5_9CORY|nr:poly-gamma-glutamate synthase PgsB [Corynebacterium liangguodongii]AWB83755.1 poly-gamma-glutamate synthase PgsB [Corynebacterium liangguodongii]PWB99435.1 poly-gamma-glutamate synthase PgsB [Corynebacterium liangguodongii]